MATFARKQATQFATNSLKIVSYNILAQRWAAGAPKYEERYFYVDAKHIEWSYRWARLQEEFTSFDADIYCLQEVELSSYQSEMLPFFKERGYDGVIQPKDNGNATFYRTSKLQVKKNNPRSRVLITSFLLKENETSSGSVGDSTVLPSTTSTAASSAEKVLHVCNVHLEGDPEKTEDRLNQVRSTLKELNKEGAPEKQRIIICGDFNCDNESPVYKLLRTASIEFTPPKKNKVTMTHGYNFESAYFASEHGEPKYTFLVKNCRADPLDFIFYTPITMKVLGCMQVIEEQDKYVPNEVNPSDHLPVASVLELL